MLYLQKDAYEGEQWAPVSAYNNDDTSVGHDWIMIGTKYDDRSTTCSEYERLNGGNSPPWTVEGSNTNLKEHVLCCAQMGRLKHEQDVAKRMDPIWLDDSHGWSEGSYDDAVNFCRDLGRKRLCPYEACEYLNMCTS